MPLQREFLGWDRPFLGPLTDWLWARREELPGLTVVVPTAQSGRTLREALAERGACLAPKVVTPGHFLQTPQAAAEPVELLAWVETLEGIRDWSEFEAVFPVPPGAGEAAGWSLGLARSLSGLRSALQENALTLGSAAQRLAETVDAERWSDLRRLEERMLRTLAGWGVTLTRSSALEARVRSGRVEGRIVLAGVADLPGAVARLLAAADTVSLIAAPVAEADRFDALGRPLPDWSERPLDWPVTGEVLLSADPRQQALEALRLAAGEATPSAGLALASADEETAGELVRAFGRAGWAVHDPARRPVSGLRSWLAAWRRFMANPAAAEAIDLLGFAATGALVGGRRAQRAAALSKARDHWLSRDRDDLERAFMHTAREDEREQLQLAIGTLEALEKRRGIFLREGFFTGLGRLLGAIEADETESAAIFEWLETMGELGGGVERDAGFWMDSMLASLPEVAPAAPEDRVLDVLGWLELLHQPGRHLIVCGLNEGKVPARARADAWLPESARGLLGLSTDAERAARDAYLLTALIEARKAAGRVDLLLAKSGAGGEALLPSRLLLAAEAEALPARVTALFRELEPPDAGLAWTLDPGWKWRPRESPLKPRLSVTAFSDYLACPFRFYLKHGTNMREPEPERVEWNARDFGNIAHLVLERWALDEEARDFSAAEALDDWLQADLDRVVAERFGSRPPLAIRIQAQSLRQRLAWFAQVQAAERAAGWHIAEVEKKFELAVDGFTVVGKVDRIERHEDGRRRVLDYKTRAAASAVESAHRSLVTAATRLPAHLKEVEEILCTTADGKTKRWKNLQVALYSAALGDVDELGYFALGATEGDVKLSLWEDFSIADRDSAMACARWVIGRLKEGVFGPPAEKVEWDDYGVLTFGRTLAETLEGGGQ